MNARSGCIASECTASRCIAPGSLDQAPGRRHGADMTRKPRSYMELALQEAADGASKGEVPVGAVLVDGKSGEVIARSHNQVEGARDPTAHAEMIVIREAAARLGLKRLSDADLYVTLEPGARLFAKPTFTRRPEVVGGIDETRCAAMLRHFFRQHR